MYKEILPELRELLRWRFYKPAHIVKGSVIFIVGCAGFGYFVREGGGFGEAVSVLLVMVGMCQVFISGRLGVFFGFCLVLILYLVLYPFLIAWEFLFIRKKGKDVNDDDSY